MSILETISNRNKLRKLQKGINKINMGEIVSNYIYDCYQLTKSMGLIKSQYDFSKQFLNSNKYYMGKLICESKSPSIECVSTLVDNMELLVPIADENYAFKNKLKNLCSSGREILKAKLLS